MSNPATQFDWPIQIYYEDTDCGGVVYYANYLRFLERARTEWLRSLGFEQDQLRDQHGVLFAVRAVDIRYHLPAVFNDKLNVATIVEQAKPASMQFLQKIYRQQELLITATVNIVCLRENSFKPCPIPNPIMEVIS